MASQPTSLRSPCATGESRGRLSKKSDNRSMKLGIMQPYFFPYIGYFQLIHAVDRFFLYDNLDFSSGSWMNHNRILVVGRLPTSFSAPVRQRKATKTIRNTELVGGSYWRRKLLRSIEVNYQRAPYFRVVCGLVEDVLMHDAGSLAEMNKYCIVEVCKFLGLETEILTDSRSFNDLEAELRREGVNLAKAFPEVRLEVPQRKVVRLLELCRALGADVFINALGGRALYSKEVFARNGVQLLFIGTRPYTYPQRSSSFFPDLSIIDVLMNCGRDATRRLAGEYDLV